jgi:putative SOS response-associated peptidase YedK
MRAGIRVPFEVEPSYNIAPMTSQPVVRLDRDTGERELVPMRWGLVPFWARDANVSHSTINAKAETLTMSQTYSEPINIAAARSPRTASSNGRSWMLRTNNPLLLR